MPINCCQVRSKSNLCNLYIAMRPHWIKNLCILCGCVSGILEAWKSNSFLFSWLISQLWRASKTEETMECHCDKRSSTQAPTREGVSFKGMKNRPLFLNHFRLRNEIDLLTQGVRKMEPGCAQKIASGATKWVPKRGPFSGPQNDTFLIDGN